MSERWIFYPCQMGDHEATVLFNYSISETECDCVPPYVLSVRLPFNHPRSDGFYEKIETDSLNRFEDDLTELAAGHQSLYVGRVTTNGARHYYVYTPDSSEEQWASRLGPFGREHGYALQFYVEADEKHKRYWDELFPTPDDWRVIKDMQVLEVLRERHDNPDIERHVDHWAYFGSESTANEFGIWASAEGYEITSIHSTDENEYCVQFAHEGRMHLGDVTAHTVRLDQQTRSVGGRYDGWETVLCNEEGT